MTPLRRYRFIQLVKYSAIVLIVFFILSIPINFIPFQILPIEIANIFGLGFEILKRIGWLASITMLIIFWLLFTKLDQRIAGYKGEALGQKELRKLKKYGYEIFANMKLKYDNDKSEMDFIVIGSNGIFIVEVKNMKGIITGHIDDQHLTQIKKTKYNTYENKFYNPVKQVNTHVYKLSKYLKDNNIDYWIEGYVYFPKKHSSIQVKNNKSIYSKNGKNSLVKHIGHYQSDAKITVKNKEIIIALMEKYAVKI